MHDFAIIGGGIIGLSTAMALSERYPDGRVLILEKESDWGHHQTGHNSGVIHSGIYYRPGSLKARFARAGNRAMVEFCQQHGIEHEVCGKLIVATAPEELPLLEDLHQRGLENGLEVTRLRAEELKEIEPHLSGLAGIRVPSTGIVSYRQVAQTFARLMASRGAELHLRTTVQNLHAGRDGVVIESDRGPFHARFLVNCAGLHSDRMARLGQADVGARIVPFRGEYFELRPERRHLVKHLIYPVPNPSFPFLGIHFTRMVDGGVHVGPNAVLSFKREGYRKSDFDLKDLMDIITYPPFWRLARNNLREGAKEIYRSFSKAAFARSAQRLVPEVSADDLVPAHAGVRAQALTRDGRLMDDFLIASGRRSIHVCNAPSPAATACIPIARAVVERIVEQQE